MNTNTDADSQAVAGQVKRPVGPLPVRLRAYSADPQLCDDYAEAMQDAATEIDRLSERNAEANALAHALKVLLCDAEEADYMTGREREIFARQALVDFGRSAGVRCYVAGGTLEVLASPPGIEPGSAP